MEIDAGPGIDEQAPPEGDFVVGSTGLVSRTLSVWGKNILTFIILFGILSAIFTVVRFFVLWMIFGDPNSAQFLMGYMGTDPFSFFIGLFSLVQLNLIQPDMMDTFVSVSLLLMVVSMIVYAVLIGATIKYSIDDYGRGQAHTGESVSVALGRSGTLIMAQLIVGFISAVLFAPALFYILLFPLTIATVTTFLVVILATFVLVFYVSIRLAPTAAVVIVEDRSALDSVRRAFDMTSGQFWHVFAGQIILGIVVVILDIIVGLFLIGVAVELGWLGGLLPVVISGLLFVAIPYVFQAVLYLDLEARSLETSQQLW
ncbi:MAG: hypothetical protein ACFE8Z_03950 [Candidatus Hermodarchaeota archaeon]